MGTAHRLFLLEGESCAGLSLLCSYEDQARSSALLINGEAQMGPNGQLGARSVQRFRVSELAITGRWRHGLVLRSAHLCAVQNLNIVGDGCASGCAAAMLLDGHGSPTGHTVGGCRLYQFGVGERPLLHVVWVQCFMFDRWCCRELPASEKVFLKCMH